VWGLSSRFVAMAVIQTLRSSLLAQYENQNATCYRPRPVSCGFYCVYLFFLIAPVDRGRIIIQDDTPGGPLIILELTAIAHSEKYIQGGRHTDQRQRNEYY